MTVFGGIVVFVVVWWLVFFAALPWGVRRGEGADQGHDAGAPAHPHLWIKAAVTTIIAALLTLAVWFVVTSDLLSFRS